MNKQNSIKRVILNSGLYSITSIFQKAIGFFLLPLYTIFLTPKDYGITGLVNSFTGVLSMLFTLSLTGAVTRFYYEYKDEPDKLRDFWGSIIVFVMLNSIVLSLTIIFFKDIFVVPFIKGIEFSPYILIGILTVVVTPVYNIYQSILQTKEDAKTYSINSSLYFLAMLILNIMFIVVFKWGATGQLLAYLLVGCIFAIYSIYELLKKKIIKLTFNKHYIFQALRYSIPLIPHLMSGSLAIFVSRLFLNNTASTAELGLFNVGAQFLIIIDTLQMSVNNAYVPWFYGIMKDGKEEHYQVIKFADFLLKINCVLSLAIALFSKEIIQIFTESSYTMAWIVIPVLMVAYQIRGIYLFYVNTLFYNKKASRFIFIATLSGNIISIILSALLTSRFGTMTPAIVMVFEKTVTTTIVILMSRKFEPVDFKLNKLIMYVLILTSSTAIGLIFDIQDPVGNPSVLNIVYKGAIFLIVAVALIRKEFVYIKGYLEKVLGKFRLKK